jgi:FAD synthetase
LALAHPPAGLVLLIAVLASFARTFDTPSASTANGSAEPTSFPEKFQAVYIVPPDAFPEVDAFVATSAQEYHLEVARYVLPMRKGLEVYLADRPNVRAIFVGTRRTDPHGENLKHFDPTDAGWPDFMRVHPVIDWHYSKLHRHLPTWVSRPRHLGRPTWISWLT